MKYNSIGEYFYRLSNRCLGMVLLPVTLVLAAYLVNHYFFSRLLRIPIEAHLELWVVLEAGFLLLIIVMQAWLASTALKPMRLEPSLGKRINNYVKIVMIRFRSFSFMLLLIGGSVFLTGALIFLYLLPIPVMLIWLYWPFHSRMSTDLKLKAEEKEILKNKTLGV